MARTDRGPSNLPYKDDAPRVHRFRYVDPGLPPANASQDVLYDYWSSLSGNQSGSGVPVLSGSCPEPDARALDVDLTSNVGGAVHKTVFDGPMLLFVAGLEGTGHHFWMKAHSGYLDEAPSDLNVAIRRYRRERKQICGAMGSVATNCSDGLRRYTKNWLDGPRQDIVRALKEFKERPKVDTPRRRRRNKDAPRSWNKDANVYLLQHTSYPDYRDGPRAIFDHPHLDILAQLAEDSSVDIRYLVITRNPDAMLRSDVLLKHLCAGDDAMERQEDYLIHNANVLISQLERLDRSFYFHSSYDDLPAISEELSAFYSKGLALRPAAWPARIKSTFSQTLPKSEPLAGERLRGLNDKLVQVAKQGTR